MAAINVTLNGVIVDLYGRVISGPVKVIGELMYSDRGVGGGPVFPPAGGGGGGGGDGDHIWGPTDPRPTPPIANVPGIPNPNPPNWGAHPEHPIVIPPPQLPPDAKPPEPPAPGSPTTVVPGNWPVAPITPPPYLIVNYPGIGPVTVAPPAPAS